MEMISALPCEWDKNKAYKMSFGIFKCTKCDEKVKRPMSIGKLAKTCGCTRRNIVTKGILFVKRIESRTRPDGKLDGYGLFKCPACGKEIERTISEGKKMKSCGCVNPLAMLRHGDYDTRLYHIWRGMKQRCLDANSTHYIDYGGRGITICREWDEDYVTFKKWALFNGYDEKLQIDRIDNNSGYYSENCRWVTIQQNSTNRRSSKLNEQQVREIKNEIEKGILNQRSISEKFNICQQHVSDIKKGRRWATIR